MYARHLFILAVLCAVSFHLAPAVVAADKTKETGGQPPKVYVPYEKLRDVFEKKEQGVFLPYEDFQRLWHAAQGRPMGVAEAPFEYLISTARFQGKVEEELATLRLELTIDILATGWVRVPVGLGEVGVSKAEFIEPKNTKVRPLLRVTDGQYVLMAKGKGRYVLAMDFVRQLKTEPGLHVLNYRIPSASITTLELLIPEENLKVDVEPMLAATTSQVEAEGAKATRLQAFLGSARQVRLSWKPKTEAAPELEPVTVCEQFQHIDIAEALVGYQVRLDYTIRRGGVDSFTVQLPGQFRVTDVSGANISRWDVNTTDPTTGQPARQTLQVKLFSPAKDKYTLTVKMERFLQEAQSRIPLVPVTTEQVMRQTGLIGITCSPRRLVALKDLNNLARVDTGQLPHQLQDRPGVTAYRFIAADYSATLAIETASPRITVDQRWTLGIDSDRLQLRARIEYKVERTGVFELKMNFPEPWKIESVGPDHLVDDHQLKGQGDDRLLHVLLKRENTGEFHLDLLARADRPQPEADVNFALPLADANDLQLYRGELVLLLADQLRAEVKEVEQLQAIPIRQARTRAAVAGLSPVMAFEFRAIDFTKSAGASFKIAVKPPQVSAVVHRLVNIQRGSIDHEAIIEYRIRYAPVDTFYLKVPRQLDAAGIQISGANIKEKPRIEQLPPDQRTETAEAEVEDANWVYYKVVLQSKVIGSYRCKIQSRQTFQAGQVGQPTTIKVEPILAAGKLSVQNGHVAVAKAETLAIGEPSIDNLIPADAGSAVDLPYERHRRIASLAFKYNAPPFGLSFPVVTQKEATVFTTILSGAIIEQVLARDGMLNTHAIYLLETSQGDRLPVTLPSGAELTAVLLNGDEAPVEMSISQNERIVRLPPSAGRVSKFVLEISYGLKGVSPSRLTAPVLPQEIPVQQTLWRLWIPQDYYLLGHNRVFSRLEKRQIAENMRATLARRQPSPVEFKLSAQGKVCDFVRQGAPGMLSVMLMSKEAFNIAVWALVVAAGLLMLKLSGFHRVVMILAIGLVAAIVHLFLPLLISHTIRVGVFAGILVILLWVAQWAFVRLPGIREALPAGKKPQAKTTEDSPAPAKKKKQSKKDEE